MIIKRLLTNEFGNEIMIVIESSPETVTVIANSPASSTEHTWTRQEASVIRHMLIEEHEMFTQEI